jgi:hypothetical protein
MKNNNIDEGTDPRTVLTAAITAGLSRDSMSLEGNTLSIVINDSGLAGAEADGLLDAILVDIDYEIKNQDYLIGDSLYNGEYMYSREFYRKEFEQSLQSISTYTTDATISDYLKASTPLQLKAATQQYIKKMNLLNLKELIKDIKSAARQLQSQSSSEEIIDNVISLNGRLESQLSILLEPMSNNDVRTKEYKEVGVTGKFLNIFNDVQKERVRFASDITSNMKKLSNENKEQMKIIQDQYRFWWAQHGLTVAFISTVIFALGTGAYFMGLAGYIGVLAFPTLGACGKQVVGVVAEGILKRVEIASENETEMNRVKNKNKVEIMKKQHELVLTQIASGKLTDEMIKTIAKDYGIDIKNDVDEIKTNIIEVAKNEIILCNSVIANNNKNEIATVANDALQETAKYTADQIQAAIKIQKTTRKYLTRKKKEQATTVPNGGKRKRNIKSVRKLRKSNRKSSKH